MVFVRHAGPRRRRVAQTTVSLVARTAGLLVVGVAPLAPQLHARSSTAIRQSAVVTGQVIDAKTGTPIEGAVGRTDQPRDRLAAGRCV